jgi:hypothetical protein
MTAEIVLMNKTAIAIATDSAVTITNTTQEEQKIYNTINKLFMLSKHAPVGIMIYGNAEFMGIPWETIIKIYRSNLGKTKFGSLSEYAENFIAFINANNPLITESEQERYFTSTLYGYFHEIRSAIDGEVKEIIEKEGKIRTSQIAKIAENTAKKYNKELEEYEFLPNTPDDYIKRTLKKYEKLIAKTQDDVFQKLPLSGEAMRYIQAISVNLVIRNRFPINTSGIVIAGFGEKETFPSMAAYMVEGIANDRLKYKQDKNKSIVISEDNTAAIIPFAQTNTVEAFMEGIDPLLHDIMEGYVAEVLDKYPKKLIGQITSLKESEKKKLLEKAKKMSKSLYDTYLQTVENYRRMNHVDPIITAVSFLPKADMAAMAESLVSMTLFKGAISVNIENTAGGPIDVAVISKGDGFVWIKRKHYFTQDAETDHNDD